MDRSLTAIEELSGVKPERLVHAPFAHAANITSYASLKPALPYDLNACAGRFAVLYATQDKAETLGLIAAITATKPSRLGIVWPNDQGGRGLPKFLEELGWDAAIEAKHHARYAVVDAPTAHSLLTRWAEQAQPHPVPGTDLLARAGLFSHRGVDAASALLVQHLPHDLKGDAADFGCGWGYLSQAMLLNDQIKTLHAIDDDARAIALTKQNIDDARLKPLWADVTAGDLPGALDTVIMNPPFHALGRESKSLGQRFIERAAVALRRGGRLVMVANRHLPYERALGTCFATHRILYEEAGYKIIEAIKGDKA